MLYTRGGGVTEHESCGSRGKQSFRLAIDPLRRVYNNNNNNNAAAYDRTETNDKCIVPNLRVAVSRGASRLPTENM